MRVRWKKKVSRHRDRKNVFLAAERALRPEGRTGAHSSLQEHAPPVPPLSRAAVSGSRPTSCWTGST
jgi:hypothetical protein